MSKGTVIVVATGDGPAVPAIADGDGIVVAADGGLERARALGLEVAVAIGDFDSADPAALEEAAAAGTRVVRFPTAKDATDLELALDHALTFEPARVVVVASEGGRLDHLLAACLVLASPELAAVEVDAWIGNALLHVVRDERSLRGTVGETLSLLALGGLAEGIRTEGLTYPLRGETLRPGSSRGVSNIFTAEEATVSLQRGVLLAVRPGTPIEGGRT